MSNSTSNHAPGAIRRKVTAPAVRARKGGEKLTMVTAYDFPVGRWPIRPGWT